MPYKLKDSVRDKFKKQTYNKRDWNAYDEGLKNRGSLTIWFSEEAISGWNHPGDQQRKRGRQKEFSDLAIETAHTLRLVYKQGLRQTEGLMLSIINLMDLDLTIPDYSTLSRRAKVISMKRKSINSNGPVTIIVDSTGLKVIGEKEWMNYKHGTKQRKVWRKLHLAITAAIDFFRNSTSMDDCIVPPVLESSCTLCTLRFCAP